MMEQETPNAEISPECAEGATGDVVTLDDAAAQLESVCAERDQLAREKGELNDRLLRLAAEFDNFRKRSEREKAEAAEYGGSEAVTAMLAVLDDFERALKAECADPEYARGMSLIYQRMAEALRKLGLEPIESVGKPFDPNNHHALDSVEDPEVESDMVAAEYQRGYTYKGRLLRAAMVRVAVKG